MQKDFLTSSEIFLEVFFGVIILTRMTIKETPILLNQCWIKTDPYPAQYYASSFISMMLFNQKYKIVFPTSVKILSV